MKTLLACLVVAGALLVYFAAMACSCVTAGFVGIGKELGWFIFYCIMCGVNTFTIIWTIRALS